MPVYTPPPGLQPEIPLVMHWFAVLCFRLIGWKVVGQVPDEPKMLAIAAPHTSNLDGVLLVLASWIVRRKIWWMVKAEWTRPPVIGWFIRAMGGLGIDRSASHNTVQLVIQEYQQREKLITVVPPEGTRKKTNHWKTGFYWIALGANVPILPGIVDFKRKVVDVSSPLLYPSGDIEADLKILWSYYDPSMAKYPEKVSNFWIRPSGKRPLHTMDMSEIDSSSPNEQ